MSAIAVHSLDQLSTAARTNWVTAIGSQGLAGAIAASPRLRQRAVASALAANGVDARDGEAGSGPHSDEARIYLASASRFTRLCGLVAYSAPLCQLVGRNQFAGLSKAFPLGDLQLACRLQDLSAVEPGRPLDLARLSDNVTAAGALCIDYWMNALPRRLRDELAICAPVQEVNSRLGVMLDVPLAQTIVNRVAAGIQNEGARL